MKILFLVNNMEYRNGGVCTHILDLSKQYVVNGHQVYLISNGSNYDDAIRRIGIEYHQEIGIANVKFNPFQYYKSRKQLIELCLKKKIEILHLQTQSAIPLADYVKKKIGIPYIWTNHVDDIPLPFILKCFHRLYKFPVISVSSDLKNDLIQRFNIDEKYIHVVPNGIDVKQYKVLSEEEVRTFKNELGIRDEEYNICLLSRVTYNKGHDILVRAINKAQKKINKKIHLIIAGSIINNEWLQTTVVDYCNTNNIKYSYVGFQSARKIFGISDLFVLPSRKEGFGLVCIEALAMKCPVIRSNSPGWLEMRDFCNIVQIEDVDGLAESITHVYLHPKETKDKTLKGYDAVQTTFNVESVARSTIQIYNELLKR